jgi:hypothetical protein
VLDPLGQAWLARRERARFLGESFHEQPPNDMRPFGYPNEQ